ncbi:MAG: hypothetical protein KIT56_00905 [Gammaproteobacteria bacterium]|nr:hypothetical protein [Gammaproteobacteria bacterium]MCW5582444.1 hypothetical protein [Gammaproteobacteria bacterium]
MKSVSGGRPIKLTDSVLEDIIYGIGKGLTLKASCKFAGISYSALAWWMSKGKQAKKIDASNRYTVVLERIKQATYAEKIKHRKKFLLTISPRDFRYGWNK